MNPPEPNPNQERFNREEAEGAPLMAAVEQLAQRLGESVDAMEQRTMGEILRLAEQSYGEQLPEFWLVWKDWTDSDHNQPMGDL